MYYHFTMIFLNSDVLLLIITIFVYLPRHSSSKSEQSKCTADMSKLIAKAFSNFLAILSIVFAYKQNCTATTNDCGRLVAF